MKSKGYMNVVRALRKLDDQVTNRYGKTHNIEKVYSKTLSPDLSELKKNESVLYGDGKTFYYKLTKKQ